MSAALRQGPAAQAGAAARADTGREAHGFLARGYIVLHGLSLIALMAFLGEIIAQEDLTLLKRYAIYSMAIHFMGFAISLAGYLLHGHLRGYSGWHYIVFGPLSIVLLLYGWLQMGVPLLSTTPFGQERLGMCCMLEGALCTAT